MSPQIHILKLWPPVRLHLEMGPLGKWLGLNEAVRVRRCCHRTSLLTLPEEGPHGDTARRATYKPGGGLSPEMEPARTLLMDLRDCDRIHLFCSAIQSVVFVTAAQTDWYTCFTHQPWGHGSLWSQLLLNIGRQEGRKDMQSSLELESCNSVMHR